MWPQYLPFDGFMTKQNSGIIEQWTEYWRNIKKKKYSIFIRITLVIISFEGYTRQYNTSLNKNKSNDSLRGRVVGLSTSKQEFEGSNPGVRK